MPSSLQATVVICTYNGVSRLPSVLKALAQQDCSPSDWEILVVDSSSDDSKVVVEAECARLFGARARVVTEKRLGLSFARERAAQEAQGKIICFLDDDNIPEPDFVAQAIRAFQEHPRAGCLGGKVVPKWETPPTPLAEAVADFALAICNRGDKAFAYEGICSGPVGAGLCARRDLLRRVYAEPHFARSVVGGTAVKAGGGEDTAISVAMKMMHWETWYVPSLVLHHQIPASRMTREYFMRLYAQMGRGDPPLRRLHDWKARIRVLEILIGLKDLARWVRGQICGASKGLKQSCPEVAKDVHRLNQRMILSRALQAIGFTGRS
jgi:glycosyltransferase involved in cell wall biosynthesis